MSFTLKLLLGIIVGPPTCEVPLLKSLQVKSFSSYIHLNPELKLHCSAFVYWLHCNPLSWLVFSNIVVVVGCGVVFPNIVVVVGCGDG